MTTTDGTVRCGLLGILGLVSLSLTAPALPSNAPQLSGKWKGTFADSIGSGTVTITLTRGTIGAASGTYQTSTGGSGTLVGNFHTSVLQFILTQTTANCPGSYTGKITINGASATGSYWGDDCRGKHSNGVISLTLNSMKTPSAPQLTGPPQSSASEYVPCMADKIYLFKKPAPGEYVEQLDKGSSVTVEGQEGKWFKVRAESGNVGYINEDWLCKKADYERSNAQPTSPSADATSAGTPQSPQPVPLWEQLANAPNYYPSYPLRFKVLQAERVPYAVPLGGSTANTSCTITGLGNTLTMNCHSSQWPQALWTHVLNVMLIAASDGNAYVIACDRAFAWSRCNALRPGDIFQGRWARAGLAVLTVLSRKGRFKEATYSVLKSQSMR